MGDFKIVFIWGNEVRDWMFDFVSLFLPLMQFPSLHYINREAVFLLCDHSADSYQLPQTVTH